MVGAPAVRLPEQDGATAPGAVAIAVAAPGATEGRVRVPRPPRDGGDGGGGRPAGRPRRRWSGPLAAISVVLVLLIFVASGAWIASRSVSFIGTDENGFVTLYTGVPYDVVGFRLYSPEFVSGLPAETLPPKVRAVVTDHKLRSHDDAVDLLRQLERGQVAGQP
jgi:protein phosphatase